MVFSAEALFVLPWFLVIKFSPNLLTLYHTTPASSIFYPLLFGLLWGFAQVTFGLGIIAMGMALAFAVVMGLACLFGSLIPLLVLHPADFLHLRGLVLLASMPLLFWGLASCSSAGSRREKETETGNIKRNTTLSFAKGLAICIFTGMFGANLNLGFAFSGDIIPRAQALGANTVTATYAVWALVLGAGFVPNLAYCGYLLSRNHTWRLFREEGWIKEAMLSSAMAFLWLAGIVCYGMGAMLSGKYGTSVGFALFMAMTILVSNLLGLLTGEWKGASANTMKRPAIGVGAVLLAIFILNLGGIL
ncbi:MAG: L-rhamnose/proton symporter RhaT [Terriglobia bacterium]